MKKFITLGITLLILLVTTGCTKYTYNIEIDRKNNLNITTIKAVNKQSLEAYNPKALTIFTNEIEKKIAELNNNNYDAKKYSDDIYEGIEYSQKIEYEKLSKKDLPQGFKPLNNKPINFYKGLIRDTYEINWLYDIKKTIIHDTQNDYLQNFEINYKALKPEILELTIKLPYKALEHNATEVIDKKVYKWKLNPYGESKIYIAYEKTDYANVMITLFLFTILILAVIKIVKIRNRNSW